MTSDQSRRAALQSALRLSPPPRGTEIPEGTRDLAGDVLGPDGRMRVLPAAYWAGTTPAERALFGLLHGVYSFPTVELVAHLREFVAGRRAIEIGSGHGVLADALGIPGTDSYQQDEDKYAAYYALHGVPAVRYGPAVQKLTASRAITRHRPKVVIGCWVTHRYSLSRHGAGGNEAGVDEEAVLYGCEAYVFVGNEQVHAGKKIWDRPHTITYPDWLYSRATNGTRDFIAVWPGRLARKAQR